MSVARTEAAHAVADARAWAAPIIDGAALPASRNRWNEEQRENERRLYAEAERRGHAAGLAAGKRDVPALRRALQACIDEKTTWLTVRMGPGPSLEDFRSDAEVNRLLDEIYDNARVRP